MVAFESIECTENAVNTCMGHEYLIVDHAETVETLAALPNVFLQPPVMSYYHHPETLEDMEKQIVGKILSRFEIDTGSYRRWN